MLRRAGKVHNNRPDARTCRTRRKQPPPVYSASPFFAFVARLAVVLLPILRRVPGVLHMPRGRKCLRMPAWHRRLQLRCVTKCQHVNVFTEGARCVSYRILRQKGIPTCVLTAVVHVSCLSSFPRVAGSTALFASYFITYFALQYMHTTAVG